MPDFLPPVPLPIIRSILALPDEVTRLDAVVHGIAQGFDTFPLTTPLPADGLLAACHDGDLAALPAIVKKESHADPRAHRAGLLPRRPLAADLAARGVTYFRGNFHMNGDHLDRYDLGEVAAEVLRDCAAAVDLTPWGALHEFRALLDVFDYDGDPTLASLAQRLKDAERTAARRPGAVSPAESADQAHALRRTADDVQASRRVMGTLAEMLHGPLTVSTPPDDDPAGEAALAWLGLHDAELKIVRPDLGRMYAAAGSPGALALPELYGAAAERWGLPTKVQGIYVFRPARALK
ncbi:hypothetical protein ATJ88_2868 [Isoptericola jiangsuensis]|uniref:Uncharacterized protein n=1 Tax=Isoptericola jiangsuensis TaxID=548579 RepID=A0A2A9F0W9_9MICO|nr:hypothetical protein [Isoptericola jiangsuensis]PFG44150.1 hypothetical protein ATJ88_2868 [Isoptericola jiangsuensis]